MVSVMKLKNLLLVFMASLFSYSAFSIELDKCYAGADAVYSTVKFANEDDFKTLRPSFVSANIFAGAHLNETISLEVGFHFSRPTRTTISSKEKFENTPGGREHHQIHRGIAISRDPYLSLIVSTPMVKNNIQLFGGYGVSYSNIRYLIKSTYINGVRHDETHLLEKTKLINKLTIGTIYHINNDVSLRWTSFLKGTSKLAVSNHKHSVKPKDSVHHAIGVLYHF